MFRCALTPERRHHRRVIARADLAVGRTRRRALGERLAGEHVVEAPADVSLPHVAPRRPPAEVVLVVRIELAPDIREPPLAQELFEHLPLLGQLADGSRLPLL